MDAMLSSSGHLWIGARLDDLRSSASATGNELRSAWPIWPQRVLRR
ncbi:hypothetical protein [Deinococcus marmoris]|uniref:Uncharacterized protein n=1 Tax=Deinococcus marmoris TaxID=249408 RepID=A0A1U7NUW4_9DEIO|nr:hypothetical protein [Deinococcus marmoris]OLV16712.1 hypothetical protein BOO71_0011005 [Deinococcus marmoris]